MKRKLTVQDQIPFWCAIQDSPLCSSTEPKVITCRAMKGQLSYKGILTVWALYKYMSLRTNVTGQVFECRCIQLLSRYSHNAYKTIRQMGGLVVA